jgi:hypothetical protein
MELKQTTPPNRSESDSAWVKLAAGVAGKEE